MEANRDNNPVVLFIDDDRGIRETIPYCIEDITGHEIVPCATIDDALALKGENVRLLIIDHFLDGVGGTPSTDYVPKLLEAYPGARVVCHTGSAKVQPGNGYDAVAYKPDSLGLLVKEVIDTLN